MSLEWRSTSWVTVGRRSWEESEGQSLARELGFAIPAGYPQLQLVHQIDWVGSSRTSGLFAGQENNRLAQGVRSRRGRVPDRDSPSHPVAAGRLVFEASD